MTTARLAPRTALFLPASNPRAIEKARGLAADLIILDLEDAVRPEAKADARGAAVAAVAQGFGPHLVATRINGIDSAEHGAAYTRKRRPVTLVWSAQFDSIVDAFAFEKRVQGWSRAKREALITGDTTRLPGLSRRGHLRPRVDPGQAPREPGG